MPREDRSGLDRRLWCVVAMVAVVSAAGCQKVREPAIGIATRSEHQKLLDEARKDYKLEKERKAIPGNAGAIGVAKPVKDIVVSAAAMTRRDGLPAEQHHFVGAFRSNKPYERLGFGEGWNYIWRNDSPDPKNPTYIVVPEDMSLSMYHLKYDKAAVLTPEQHNPPLAVQALTRDGFVIGACVEGPCGAAYHCGVSDAGAVYQ